MSACAGRSGPMSDRAGLAIRADRATGPMARRRWGRGRGGGAAQAARERVAAWFLARPDAGRRAGTPAEFCARVGALADGVQFPRTAAQLARRRRLFSASISGTLHAPAPGTA